MTPLPCNESRADPDILEKCPGKIEGKTRIFPWKNGQVFDNSWRMSCYIGHIGISQIGGMIAAHYLHKRPAIATCCLAMYHNIFAVGMIIFAMPPKEIDIRYGGVTWELARLWIDDSVPNNSETWFISKAVKHIQNEHKEVMYLVSYADPSAGHCGTIYKASNWEFDGMTDAGRKTPRCDYINIESGKKYSRQSHIPQNVEVSRIPRVSKYRYKLQVRKYA